MPDKKRDTAYFLETAETLKAAGHPERLAIMSLLWRSGCMPMNVKLIYESLRLQQSAVSRHLGILKRCGLLEKTGGGNNTCYSLDMSNPITISMIDCLQNNND